MSEPRGRTSEQLEWIRDRFKPDGLLRLAQSTQDYYDHKGYYLPDVAALAYENGRERDKALAALASLREGGSDAWAEVSALVDEQAEDEGLWGIHPFGQQPITEAYLQQELRRLHAAVERASEGGGARETEDEDLLEVCQAAEAQAAYRRWLGYPEELQAADRIDQAVVRLRGGAREAEALREALQAADDERTAHESMGEQFATTLAEAAQLRAENEKLRAERDQALRHDPALTARTEQAFGANPSKPMLRQPRKP